MYGFILEPSPMSSEILEAELQEDGVVVILGADGIQYLLAERRQGSGGVYQDYTVLTLVTGYCRQQ